MRKSLTTLQRCAIDCLLDSVRHQRIKSVDADDVFKMCAAFPSSGASADPLGLRSDIAIQKGLYCYWQLIEPQNITAFQNSFIKDTFDKLNFVFTPEVACSAAPPTIAQHRGTVISGNDDISVDQRLAAIWEIVSQSQQENFVGGNEMKKIEGHCKALEELSFRTLSVNQLLSLIKALAVVHFKDYSLCSKLCRAVSPVASLLTVSQACNVLFNLMKLNAHDSMVAVVNKIDACVEQMNERDAMLFFQAAERQPNTSAVMAKCLPKLASRAAVLTPKATSVSFHRTFLGTMSKYNLGRHPSILVVVADLARFQNGGIKLDRDLPPLLQSLVELKIPPAAAGVSVVLNITKEAVRTCDIRSIEKYLDFLSVYPCDSTEMMETVMGRISQEANLLSSFQLTVVAELVSSYPPAKGHACGTAMCFSAAMTKEAFDAEHVERIIRSFVELHCFTGDFYDLCDFAASSRQGVARTFASLKELLGLLPATVVSDPRMKNLLRKAIDGLAHVLNDEEVNYIKKAILQLGIDDRELQAKIVMRVRQLQREAGMKQQQRLKKGYDPVDDLL